MLFRHRRLILLFTILVFIISIIIPVVNIVTYAAQTKQTVYDFASLLTKDEIENLEKMSNKYGPKRNTDFIILTTKDTGGRDVVQYMEDFYDENALGYDKPHGNTAILTIDMQNREVYVAGFYKAEKYLDNSRCDLIRNKITPDLSSGNYYDAFSTFIKTSYKYMGIRPGVNPDNILLNLWFQIFASLGIAGIALSIMAYKSEGRMTVSQNSYLDPSHSNIVDRRDLYVRTTTTKYKKPSSNNSSGGRIGGGGGGISRGGHSHSGSRGKF